MKSLLDFFKTDSGETEPSAEVIDGRISYKFRNGLEAHQEEFDTDQNEKLLTLLMGIDTNDLSPELSSVPVSAIISLLIKENLLVKILGIILIRNVEDRDTDIKLLRGLKNSELIKVFNDFFSLNPTAISLLKTFGQDLISMSTTRST